MKLVLKDKTEITISSMNDNYNSNAVSDTDKRSIAFTINNPEENITIDYLSRLLTEDNLSAAHVVSDTATKAVEPCNVTNISENITDKYHSLTIRACYK